MVKISKKNRKKRNRRIVLVTIFCLVINIYIIYSVGIVFKEVHDKKIESKNLTVELNELKDEEDILKSEVNKLKDPVYVGKYAREKFLYSGDDEFIIRMK